jgi:hypothetical protein
MKRHPLIAMAAAATLCTAAFVPGALAHDHAPRHGGVVVETRSMDIELVAKPGVIHLHLSDHGQPLDASKASARLTLLSGADKQEVELKSVGDKLEAKGSFAVGPGTKAVAVVTVPGRAVATARFLLK